MLVFAFGIMLIFFTCIDTASEAAASCQFNAGLHLLSLSLRTPWGYYVHCGTVEAKVDCLLSSLPHIMFDC